MIDLFFDSVSINMLYSTKEYSYTKCKVIDILFAEFSYVNSNKLIESKIIKLINAEPFICFDNSRKYSINIVDISSLNFESIHYKLILNNNGVNYEIICDTIEYSGDLAPCVKITSKKYFRDIKEIKEKISEYNFIKSYQVFCSENHNISEIHIELTNDEYMIDDDTVILVFKDFFLNKLQYIGSDYHLYFDLTSLNYDNTKYHNQFIAAIDDMINTIEIYFNECYLIV